MSTPVTPWYPMTHDDAERMNEILGLMAINASGQVSDVQNWKAVQNIIRAGLGPKAFPVGTQFRVRKETSLAASMGVHEGISAVTVAEETFLAHEGIVGTGIHEFVYDGAAWIYHGEPVSLTAFGITIEGTPASGDEIIVTEAFTEIVWDVVAHKKTDDGISAHSPTSTYAVGALCTNNGYVWVCITAIGTAGAWDASKWQKLYPAGENRMILLMHNCWYNRPVDPGQALIAVPEDLEAGTYNFTYGEKTYQFTLASDVAAGSQMKCGYPSSGSDLAGQTMSVYANGAAAAATQTAAISEGSEGTSLGTVGDAEGNGGNINHISRMRYGSNNYKESALRQWLNSKARASEWWAAQTSFQRVSGYANEAGFLHGMDSDFLAVVQDTAVRCCTNNTWELYGWTKNTPYTLVDKFYPPSTPEVGFNADTNQGTCWPYYSGSKNVDRIKQDFGGTARGWWLRSPYPSHANYVRGVVSDGSLSYNSASYGHSAAAACEIG